MARPIIPAKVALVCKATQVYEKDFLTKFLLLIESIGIKDENHPIYCILYKMVLIDPTRLAEIILWSNSAGVDINEVFTSKKSST